MDERAGLLGEARREMDAVTAVQTTAVLKLV